MWDSHTKENVEDLWCGEPFADPSRVSYPFYKGVVTHSFKTSGVDITYVRREDSMFLTAVFQTTKWLSAKMMEATTNKPDPFFTMMMSNRYGVSEWTNIVQFGRFVIWATSNKTQPIADTAATSMHATYANRVALVDDMYDVCCDFNKFLASPNTATVNQLLCETEECMCLVSCINSALHKVLKYMANTRIVKATQTPASIGKHRLSSEAVSGPGKVLLISGDVCFSATVAGDMPNDVFVSRNSTVMIEDITEGEKSLMAMNIVLNKKTDHSGLQQLDRDVGEAKAESLRCTAVHYYKHLLAFQCSDPGECAVRESQASMDTMVCAVPANVNCLQFKENNSDILQHQQDGAVVEHARNNPFISSLSRFEHPLLSVQSLVEMSKNIRRNGSEARMFSRTYTIPKQRVCSAMFVDVAPTAAHMQDEMMRVLVESGMVESRPASDQQQMDVPLDTNNSFCDNSNESFEGMGHFSSVQMMAEETPFVYRGGGGDGGGGANNNCDDGGGGMEGMCAEESYDCGSGFRQQDVDACLPGVGAVQSNAAEEQYINQSHTAEEQYTNENLDGEGEEENGEENMGDQEDGEEQGEVAVTSVVISDVGEEEEEECSPVDKAPHRSKRSRSSRKTVSTAPVESKKSKPDKKSSSRKSAASKSKSKPSSRSKSSVSSKCKTNAVVDECEGGREGGEELLREATYENGCQSAEISQSCETAKQNPQQQPTQLVQIDVSDAEPAADETRSEQVKQPNEQDFHSEQVESVAGRESGHSSALSSDENCPLSDFVEKENNVRETNSENEKFLLGRKKRHMTTGENTVFNVTTVKGGEGKPMVSIIKESLNKHSKRKPRKTQSSCSSSAVNQFSSFEQASRCTGIDSTAASVVAMPQASGSVCNQTGTGEAFQQFSLNHQQQMHPDGQQQVQTYEIEGGGSGMNMSTVSQNHMLQAGMNQWGGQNVHVYNAVQNHPQRLTYNPQQLHVQHQQQPAVSDQMQAYVAPAAVSSVAPASTSWSQSLGAPQNGTDGAVSNAAAAAVGVPTDNAPPQYDMLLSGLSAQMNNDVGDSARGIFDFDSVPSTNAEDEGDFIPDWYMTTK